MAMVQTGPCVLLFFSNLLLLHAIFPCFAIATTRKLSTKPGYQTFYLDGRYKKMRAELLVETKVSSTSEKLWSMKVIHRDSLHSSARLNSTATEAKLSFSDALLQRMERDAARVSAIEKRIKVAQAGGITTKWEPAKGKGVEMSQEEFNSPIISGIKQGSGEYFTELGIGTPTKPAYFVIDTGSDLCWIQCQPCGRCYQQTEPIFNPAQSTSYNPVTCSQPLCSELLVRGCHSNQCLYEDNYVDGSFTIGDFAMETLTFGGNHVEKVALGCGHDNEGLFIGASGLLGMGAGQLSIPSQIKQPFSYCLADRFSDKTSSLVFGLGAAPFGSVFTPLLRNARLGTFYYLGLQGISVGGSQLNIAPSVFTLQSSGNGGVIIDSGTSITHLVASAYIALRDSFRARTSNLPSASSFSLFDTCYALKGMSSVDVPAIDLHFAGGTTLSLPATNYLIPVDMVGTYCLGFAGMNASYSVIGNLQQQGYRVSFNTATSKVGFAAGQC